MNMLKRFSLSDNQPSTPPTQTVICLGNFDGVHRAHQALIHKALSVRRECFPHAAVAVLCFREPSTDILKSTPPKHLCSFEQKLAFFRDAGAEYVILADFAQIRTLSPKQFVDDVLTDACGCVAAICGFNYHFGYMGAGDAATLTALFGGQTVVQDEIRLDGMTVSSTNIRAMIASGEVKHAAALLGRPYALRARIVHGKGLGHKIGVPTVNQFFPDSMVPPRTGVYITDCSIDGKTYRGISNVGVHPTVDMGAALNCETHLLDCNEDLYDKIATIHFLERLRDEQKFDSIDALTRQIALDASVARAYQA